MEKRMSSSSKPTSFKQKIFILSLFILSFSLLILVLSFKQPKPHLNLRNHNLALSPELDTAAAAAEEKPANWFDLISREIGGGGKRKVKVGLVNLDVHGDEEDSYNYVTGILSGAEKVNVHFDRVSGDKKWEDFFPEWIDEYHKWAPPSCPDIPMPAPSPAIENLDVIVARVPCAGSSSSSSESEGIRDVFRLQVNLVVANLAVANGWVKPDVKRTVYVVFVGKCGPMVEIFRCDDMVTRGGYGGYYGNYWVYRPELRRLKHKVLMPVGSCQIAPPYAETGKEVWRYFMSQSRLSKLNYTTYHQREAYVTIIHSSEAYVCGAIALAQSIIQNNSTKDLVLLYDDSISAKSLRGLRAAGWKTKRIERIRSPFSKKDSYNEWNYSKLRVWQLTEYDKVIFIDSDLLVLKNIDNLFYYPQLSASGNDKSLFNSGLMVLEPSSCMYEELVRKSHKISSYNGGDQGFLNEVFTWWHRLPSRVNRLKLATNDIRPRGENRDNHHDHQDEDAYAIHYLGLKPWMCYKDYDCNWDMVERHLFARDSFHRKWWQVYDVMPRRLQQYCGLTKKMDSRIKKWRRIAKNARLADGHWKIEVKDPRQYHLSQ